LESEESLSYVCFLPPSQSWVLDYSYHNNRLRKGSSIRVSSEREKEEREEMEKDSSLAFFSYKKRPSSGRCVVSPAKYRSGVTIGMKETERERERVCK